MLGGHCGGVGCNGGEGGGKGNVCRYCFCSVTQSWLTLCNPMDCSMPGSPVLHYLLKFAQTHVHWVGDAISSSVTPFSSHLQSFPALGSCPISWLFTADDQNIGASASAAVLPMNIHEFPLGLTGLIPLLSEGLSRVFSKIMVQKHQFLALSLHVHVQIFTSICDYWENHSFD